MLLRAEAVSKSFGPKDLIRSVDLLIESGDRIGLVGRNGVGKTTLINILMGTIRPDIGDIFRGTERIGYLPQLPKIGPDQRVRDVIGTPFGDLSKVRKRLAELEDIMTTDVEAQGLDWNEVASEYSRLQEEVSQEGTGAISAGLVGVLEEVGIPSTMADRKFSELSGGEGTKVMLARVLMQSHDADILFLDEPTSHLDIETTEWLEDYLLTMKGALVVISHDRYFLDRAVTKVWDLDEGNLLQFKGNYSTYLGKKALEVEKQRKMFKKNQAERNRQLKIAEEQFRRNPYLTTHKTRLKMLERTTEVDSPYDSRDISLTFDTAEKSGKDVLLIKGMKVWRGGHEEHSRPAGRGEDSGTGRREGQRRTEGREGKRGAEGREGQRGTEGRERERGARTPEGKSGTGGQERREILRNVDLTLEKGERIGIFGPNGSGKSTFVKALLGELPSEGDVWVAPGARIGYFAQGHDLLDRNLTPEEQILLVVGKDEKPRARNILARFLLTGDNVERPISTLSGGERARLALAVLLSEKKNLLILDEPTNYLDILSRGAVESALQEYPGTLVIVSHDRYLLDSVCTKVGDLRNGTLKVYNGNYSKMKGQKRTSEVLEDAHVYRVVAGFTDWATKTKYRAGEKINIADTEMELYEWAFDNGKLKKIPGKKERKHVKKP